MSYTNKFPKNTFINYNGKKFLIAEIEKPDWASCYFIVDTEGRIQRCSRDYIDKIGKKIQPLS